MLVIAPACGGPTSMLREGSPLARRNLATHILAAEARKHLGALSRSEETLSSNKPDCLASNPTLPNC
jgi:hypothetical protein